MATEQQRKVVRKILAKIDDVAPSTSGTKGGALPIGVKAGNPRVIDENIAPVIEENWGDIVEAAGLKKRVKVTFDEKGKMKFDDNQEVGLGTEGKKGSWTDWLTDEGRSPDTQDQFEFKSLTELFKNKQVEFDPKQVAAAKKTKKPTYVEVVPKDKSKTVRVENKASDFPREGVVSETVPSTAGGYTIPSRTFQEWVHSEPSVPVLGNFLRTMAGEGWVANKGRTAKIVGGALSTGTLGMGTYLGGSKALDDDSATQQKAKEKVEMEKIAAQRAMIANKLLGSDFTDPTLYEAITSGNADPNNGIYSELVANHAADQAIQSGYKGDPMSIIMANKPDDFLRHWESAYRRLSSEKFHDNKVPVYGKDNKPRYDEKNRVVTTPLKKFSPSAMIADGKPFVIPFPITNDTRPDKGAGKEFGWMADDGNRYLPVIIHQERKAGEPSGLTATGTPQTMTDALKPEDPDKPKTMVAYINVSQKGLKRDQAITFTPPQGLGGVATSQKETK
jgi:hypothetical protein